MTEQGTHPRQRLWIKRLDVARTPGIRSPYSLDNLAPGITILFGPNGCGKSTTAQSLMRLLWTDSVNRDHFEVTGWVDLAETAWRIECDRFGTRYDQDGLATASLPIDAIPIETRDRYLLTLHDLIGSNDEAFAHTIQRESVGGFDLEAAATRLGYRKAIPGRNKTRDDVANAQRQLHRASQYQLEIERDAGALVALHQQLDLANQAQVEIERLRAAIRCLQAASALERATEIVDAFPATLSALNGSELDQLAALQSRRADLQSRQHETEVIIAGAQADLAETGLANLPADSLLVAQLQQEHATIARQEDRIGELTGRAAGLNQRRRDARTRIGPDITEEQMTAMDEGGLHRFVQLSRKLELAALQRDAKLQLERWLGTVSQPTNIPDLSRATDVLWRIRGLLLAETSRAEVERVRRLLWASLAVGIVLVLIASAIADPRFAVLILAPLIVGAIAIRQRQSLATADVEPLIAEFSRSGLPAPTEWTVLAVEASLTARLQELRRAEVDHEKWNRWEALATERAAVSAIVAEVQREVDELSLRYGIIVNLDAEYRRSMVDSIVAWRVADLDYQTVQAELSHLRTQYDQLLRQFNTAIAPIVGQTAASAASALGLLESLRQRVEAHAAATSRLTGATNTLTADIVPELDRIVRERRALYARLGLEPVDDDAVMTSLVGQLSDFNAAKQARGEAEGAVKQAVAVARDEHGVDDDMLSCSHIELNDRLREQLELAAESERLSNEITRIATLVDEAKAKREV